MPVMGRHSLAMEVSSRLASRARSLGIGMMGPTGVAGDGAARILWSQLLAAPPTQAQGQPLPDENSKLPKASTANCF